MLGRGVNTRRFFRSQRIKHGEFTVDEILKLQERLKEIANQMQTISDAEEPTEEQLTEYEALEVEADQLTASLAELREEEAKQNRRQRAQEIRDYARSSPRQTRPGTPPRIGRVRAGVENDPRKGFQSFGHFAARVLEAGASPRGDEQLMQVAAGTGYQQSISSDGGVLVPPEFSKSIWDRVMLQSDDLLQYCDIVSIDPGVESITVPAMHETSRADGSRQGGIQGYWKGELSQLDSSKGDFREIKLEPRELYVYSFISDKLLRNAPQAASQILEQGAADEIAFKIGDAIINGDGAGKPLGILNSAATVNVADETGNEITPLDVSNMHSRLHPRARMSARWFINVDVEPELHTMSLTVGDGGTSVYLPPGGYSQSPYATLLGKPVTPVEYCASLNTPGDIILADLSYYAVGIKGSGDQAYSMHLKFDYAQTAFRFIFEVDGMPWVESALTPYKGSNTLSPFLTLDTRT